MNNLCEFAENILQRNFIDVMIEIVCSLTDDEIKTLASV